MKKFFILFLIICSIQTAKAEIAKVTAQEAVEIAMDNNLELQAKKKDIEIKYQEIKIANELKNPQFQSNFLMGKVTRGNSSQFGGYLPIELFKRKPRKDIAIAQLNKSQEEISAFEHQLKIKVMKAYFDVLYAKSVLKVYEDREQLFNKMQNITKTKIKDKNYEAELLQSDIKHRKQLVFINSAKSSLLVAQLNLNDVLNIKDNSKMYDTTENSLFDENIDILDITVPSYETIEQMALKYSHSLKIADNDIDIAQKDLIIQQHKVIPDIAIAGGTAYQTAHQTKGEALPGAFVGAYVDIPILNQYKPDINKAKEVIEKTKINKDSYECHLKMALKKDYNEFKYAKENMEHYKTILNDAYGMLKIYENKYRKNEATLLNVIQVENEYKSIVGDYLAAMNLFFSSYLDLMENVGHDILLDDDAL